jgi:AcrR family transcriptional regulator
MDRSGAKTKARILAAARECFGADGYERATIRAIARQAQIDPSMVIRYFGSKEKLFASAVDFDLQLPDLSTTPRDQVGFVLARHLLERWENDWELKILLRAGITNEIAAERMREIFAGQVGPAIAQLPGDPSLAPVRAALVSSQVLGVALCRYVVKLPPIALMDADELIGWLGPTLQNYLTGDLRRPGRS